MDYSLDELVANLNNLVNNIKVLSEDSYTQAVKDKVYLDYKEIAIVYQGLTDSDIEQLPENYKKIVEFLSVGEKAENKFNELLNQFQTNNDNSLKNVINFIKSRKGFDLLNKKTDFSDFNDEELVEIFGDLFGVNVANECVASLKAEKVGSVIGYALSGLFEADLKEYNQNPNNQTLAEFLKQKISLSDYEAKYSFSEPETGGLNVFCSINTSPNSALLKTRAANTIDHCFVNKNTKTIIFGQTTSDNDTSKQGYGFFKAYISLKELVNTKTINGEDNPYYGFKLEPFLMLGGRFVPDEVQSQEVGKSLKKMFPEVNSTSLSQLAQLQFYRMYANCPAQELVKILTEYNVFLAGCDTMNLYQFSEKIAKENDDEVKNKLIFSDLTKNITEICNTISNPTNKIDFDDSGKSLLKLMIQDIVSVVESLPRNFKKELSQEEYDETIAPLSKAMAGLKKTLEENNRLYIASDLSSLNRTIKDTKNLEYYNDWVASESSYKIGKIEWTAPEATTKKDIDISLDDLAFVKKVAVKLYNQMGYIGSQFFAKYVYCIDEVLTHGQVQSAQLIHSFSSSANYFSKTCKDLDAVKFLENTRYLLDGRLTHEKATEKSQNLIKYLVEDLAVKNDDIRELITTNVKKLKI